MDRREALQATALLFGGAIIGGQAFLTGCSPSSRKDGIVFSDEDIQLLDQVGETIIPTTADSPGAREAAIGMFMKTMVTDCYEDADQKVFADGVSALRASGFAKLSPDQQFEYLTDLNSKTRQSDKKTTHWFTMMKQLTTLGYFTSEPGCTKALVYDPAPGEYKGCVAYSKGQKADAM